SGSGVCNFASQTRIEGRAERRETFGCWEAPVGHAITRRTRRLRGALRPMTQQYTGRNNVTISMSDDGSVPIVSQREIDPMKTALSLTLALVTTTALAEPLPVPQPPGQAARAPPTQGTEDAIAKPSNGTCPWGWIASGSYCLLAKWPLAALAFALAFVFSVEGPITVPRGLPPRRLRIGSPEPATSRKAHGLASGSRLWARVWSSGSSARSSAERSGRRCIGQPRRPSSNV